MQGREEKGNWSHRTQVSHTGIDGAWVHLFIKCIWTSLVVQCLRICLPMQVTWVWSLVWKDSTCRGARGQLSPCATTTEPTGSNYTEGATAMRSRGSEMPTHRTWRAASTCHKQREPARSNEDPAQPKIHKRLKRKRHWTQHLLCARHWVRCWEDTCSRPGPAL